MPADGTSALVSVIKAFLKTTANDPALSTQQLKLATRCRAHPLAPSPTPSAFVPSSQAARRDCYAVLQQRWDAVTGVGRLQDFQAGASSSGGRFQQNRH